MDLQGPYRMGALFALLSAALHVVALVVGAGQLVMPLLVGTVVWIAFGLGLLRGWRWLAYLAFVMAMIGAIFAMGHAQVTHGLFSLALWGIVAADVLAAIALFASLWRSRVPTEVA